MKEIIIDEEYRKQIWDKPEKYRQKILKLIKDEEIKLITNGNKLVEIELNEEDRKTILELRKDKPEEYIRQILKFIKEAKIKLSKNLNKNLTKNMTKNMIKKLNKNLIFFLLDDIMCSYTLDEELDKELNKERKIIYKYFLM